MFDYETVFVRRLSQLEKRQHDGEKKYGNKILPCAC